MIKNRMAQRGQAGFTLIELLVVVAILAILTGIAVVGIGKMRENANKAACESDKDTIETAALAKEVSDQTQVNGNTAVAALSADRYVKKVRDGGGWSVSWANREPTATYSGAAYGDQTC